jgi:poly-beta-hydroxybutyrate-responsive repressor
MERIASEFESEQINAGTLYRTLRQLEKEGLCDSAWDTSQQRGPARRMYYITEAGKAYLEAWLEACKEYRRVMDALSRAYISRTAPRSSSEQHGNDDEEEVSSSSSS